MNSKDTPPTPAADLRQRAEAEAARALPSLEPLSPEATQRMLHELRVHQIELEMQNEELRRAQAELDALRARYFDLYDQAPLGYLTLGQSGLIQEANLTAATLLGVARGALVQQPMSRFMLTADQDAYYRHRKLLLASGVAQDFDLRLHRADGRPIWARLAMAAAEDAAGARVCRVMLSDVTERKQAEEAIFQLSARLLQVQDEERRRMARELHDTTAQSLAALALNLDLLAKVAPGPNGLAQ